MGLLSRILRFMLSVAVGILTLTTMVPSVNGTSVSYLTTGVTQSGIKQTTIGGYNGVIVNYTSTYSSSFTAFVHLDLFNQAGQTVYYGVSSCKMAANQLCQFFFPIWTTLPFGNYVAWVFAATNSSIPVSTSSSVKVTI